MTGFLFGCIECFLVFFIIESLSFYVRVFFVYGMEKWSTKGSAYKIHFYAAESRVLYQRIKFIYFFFLYFVFFCLIPQVPFLIDEFDGDERKVSNAQLEIKKKFLRVWLNAVRLKKKIKETNENHRQLCDRGSSLRALFLKHFNVASVVHKRY